MLDPKQIPRFVSQLPIPPVYAHRTVKSEGRIFHDYEVDVCSLEQQILPEGFPKSTVFGYGGLVKDGDNTRYAQTSPGPTFEAIRGIPIRVKWNNKLDERHFLPVDGTIHWANPAQKEFPPQDYPIPFNPETREGVSEIQQPIPIVTHLHGGETIPHYDGHPDAWFTKDLQVKGQGYFTNEYTYLNDQPPATLWYHDHTLGMTRLNVYAGLAGFYLLNDPKESLNKVLPSGEFDVPLAIQDRRFHESGQLIEIENIGVNSNIHPYWTAESFGNTNMVNGKVWPNFNVKRRQYRFRLLNGANGRFYRLSFPYKGSKLSFTQISSDGGFLPQPVELTELFIPPGSRADILFDFSQLPVGTKIVMKNDAEAPFSPDKPSLAPSDPTTEVMQFTVVSSKSVPPRPLPSKLNSIPHLTPNAPKRLLTLTEMLGPNGKPLMLLLNGQKWGAPISEQPLVGSTEDWEFVNLTEDTHPMHLHLVQFQIVSRQAFDSKTYLSDWKKLNGEMPLNTSTKPLPIEHYVTDHPKPPAPNEQGWHDIVSAHPSFITKIRVRFAPTALQEGTVEPGENRYPFNPGAPPGYVWHCHIVDHEDNEMMRPYTIIVPSDQKQINRLEEKTGNDLYKGLSLHHDEQETKSPEDRISITIYFNNSKTFKLNVKMDDQ